jgi:hypothetical protein
MRRIGPPGQRHQPRRITALRNREGLSCECELRQRLPCDRRHQGRAGGRLPSDGLLRRHPGHYSP